MVLSDSELVEFYKTMIRIRLFEEKVQELFRKGELPGFLHLCMGQEAVAVGSTGALLKDDMLLGGHRAHGHAIAKGVPMRKIMAELFAKESGCCKGKGGSMHLSDRDLCLFLTTGIVGSSIPIADGIAFSFKLRGENRVAVTVFGDGANNTGAFHEGINLAALWKLPAVFVCDNNQYAISTHVSRSTPIANVSGRAKAYNIPGVTVDGQDVEAVYEAVKEAVDRARDGNGPSLVECKSARLYGSYAADSQSYRPKEDIEEAARRDPINLLKAKLMKSGALKEGDDEMIRKDGVAEVEDAVRYAKESPYPEPEEALRDVYG